MTNTHSQEVAECRDKIEKSTEGVLVAVIDSENRYLLYIDKQLLSSASSNLRKIKTAYRNTAFSIQILGDSINNSWGNDSFVTRFRVMEVKPQSSVSIEGARFLKTYATNILSTLTLCDIDQIKPDVYKIHLV